MKLPEQYQEPPKKKITIRKIFWAVFTAILILLAMIEIMFPAKAAHAADTGWLSANAYTYNSCESGSIWSQTSYAATSDNQYAVSSVGSLKRSNTCLEASTFTTGIPDGSTIQGIEVLQERSRTGIVGGVSGKHLQLLINGAVTGDNKIGGVGWTTSDTVTTYGGASDLWNSGYDGTQTIGIQSGQTYTGTTGSAGVQIDALQLKVYYEPPAAGFNTTFLYPFFPTAWASTTCQFVTNGSTTTAECSDTPTSSIRYEINETQNVFNGFILYFLVLFGLSFIVLKLNERG